ncbi:MAG: hypothetical protein IJJ57_09550 [Ruminococcus sp.]|nr:hypothetical protein [Ruminococcus sp.]
MKGLFSNIWTKRFFALIGALYTVGVCKLCYYSIFYNIHIDSRGSVCLAVSAVSLLALIIMLYTRKQVITRICSFVILAAMLPVVLLYFGEWELIFPIVITGIIILLLSGAGEGAKTALGTIILLMYIFGALGYFLFTSFFVSSAKQEVVDKGVSPSGKYRYEIVNTEDSSNGSTAVYVEPNYADVTYPNVTFTLKNISRVVYLDRPICQEINIDWNTQTRKEVTSQLNSISDNIKVNLSDSELEKLGHSCDSRLQLANVNVYDLFAIGKTAHDVDPIRLDTLDEKQLAHFGVGKDASGRYYVLEPSDELLEETEIERGQTVFFSELDSKGFAQFNKDNRDEYGSELYTIEKDNSIELASLTDEQLAELGVSDQGDIMTINGKICFRFYVAEIEDYFNTEKRKLSVDLLNS